MDTDLSPVEPKRPPLWTRIADELRRRIASGVPIDDLSDVTLASEFKVSTATIRQAVRQLADEGLLVRRRGKGTFLLKEPLHSQPEILECFVDEWQLQGHSVSIEILDRRLIAANITTAAGLGVPLGETVAYLCRLRLADKLPVALDYRWIPADLVEGIRNEEFLQESMWRVLRRCKNADPVESRISIRATAATSEVAEHLGLEPGEPVLNHEVQLIGDDGRVIILGSTLYHPERFIYSTRVQRRRTPPDA